MLRVWSETYEKLQKLAAHYDTSMTSFIGAAIDAIPLPTSMRK